MQRLRFQPSINLATSARHGKHRCNGLGYTGNPRRAGRSLFARTVQKGGQLSTQLISPNRDQIPGRATSRSSGRRHDHVGTYIHLDVSLTSTAVSRSKAVSGRRQCQVDTDAVVIARHRLRLVERESRAVDRHGRARRAGRSAPAPSRLGGSTSPSRWRRGCRARRSSPDLAGSLPRVPVAFTRPVESAPTGPEPDAGRDRIGVEVTGHHHVPRRLRHQPFDQPGGAYRLQHALVFEVRLPARQVVDKPNASERVRRLDLGDQARAGEDAGAFVTCRSSSPTAPVASGSPWSRPGRLPPDDVGVRPRGRSGERPPPGRTPVRQEDAGALLEGHRSRSKFGRVPGAGYARGYPETTGHQRDQPALNAWGRQAWPLPSRSARRWASHGA